MIFEALKSSSKPLLVAIPAAHRGSAWRDTVYRAFEPHFQVRTYHYGRYDRILGRIGILIDVRWLIVAMLMLVTGLVPHWPTALYPWPHYLFPAASIACIAMAIHQARRFRADVVNDLASWLGGSAKQPFVVADSFGGYLLGAALRTRPEVAIRNLVLTRAPLPRDFPWAKFFPGKMGKVRSEVLDGGFYGWMLYALRWFAEDLGDAGHRGFTDTLAVHSTVADGLCMDCKLQPVPAPVHNIRLQSPRTALLTSEAYMRSHWLPFLWSIPIQEFAALTRLASEAAEKGQTGAFDELDRVIDQFLETTFSWTGGWTVELWIRNGISSYCARARVPQRSEQEVFDFVSMRLLALIAAADEQSRRIDGDDKVVMCLHPRVALIKAIEAGVGTR